MTLSTNQLRLAIWAIVLHCMGVAIWIAGAQALVLVNIINDINDINDYGEGDSIPFTAPILIIIVGVLLQVAGGIVAARVYQISAIEKRENTEKRESQESESRRHERDLLKDQLEKAQIDYEKRLKSLDSRTKKNN